jgi:hypothetical protein
MTSMTDLPRVAVLGAGHSGPVIARALIEAGYEVSIAASGDPAEIALIASVHRRSCEFKWPNAAAYVARGLSGLCCFH